LVETAEYEDTGFVAMSLGADHETLIVPFTSEATAFVGTPGTTPVADGKYSNLLIEPAPASVTFPTLARSRMSVAICDEDFAWFAVSLQYAAIAPAT
jgi:hypothetical protein